MTRQKLKVDFDLLDELIGYHLHRAEIASFRYFVRPVEKSRYTPKQFSVLVLTRANPGLSQVDLGRSLGMDRATTMMVIDKLQSRKLLIRKRSEVDRRKHAIHLTPKGQAMTQRLVAHAQNHDKALTEKLTKREAQTLRELLIKVRAGAEE
jgi:DNA-binding MarR family transcriptional regulator